MLAQNERDRVRVGLNIELRRQLEWVVGCDQHVGRRPSGPEHAATCGRGERGGPPPARRPGPRGGGGGGPAPPPPATRARPPPPPPRQCHPPPPRAGRHI